ncbi:MAG: methyltransferase domain-containing protein [Holdemanella sp.]|nr:methyltransferase domain-containing protein [Holdemanella sp.]
MYYTTGKFAKLAGVTERTIRYYDTIHLLKPSSVSANGYRQYNEEDLIKLQKILTLRELGFSIEEIFPMVSNKESIEDSFRLQIELVQSKINYMNSLLDSLKIASNTMKSGNMNWDVLSNLVKINNESSALIENYKNASNLNARIALHENYSTNPIGWYAWIASNVNWKGLNRVLEVGCGNGKLWDSVKVNLRHREIFLSDNSQGMVEYIRKKLGKDFNCLVCHCEQIPFKDAYFDGIFANHVLFYSDLSKSLQEISRVLKPDGVLYATTYGKDHMKEITEIVHGFDQNIQLSSHALYDIFGLENGMDVLSPYFSNIERREYEDALLVDKAKPIVDYILSCHGNQNEILMARYDMFYAYIESLLEKGPIKITKQACLFICHK